MDEKKEAPEQCPLKMMGVLSGSIPERDFTDCICSKSHCAWWVSHGEHGEHGECLMQGIAYDLGEIRVRMCQT